MDEPHSRPLIRSFERHLRAENRSERTVDLDLEVLLVLGKGRRERTLPFGRKAGEALHRYLHARARHKDAALPWLWLGKKGRLTEWGLLVIMLRRRGAQAGLPGLHPHHGDAHEVVLAAALGEPLVGEGVTDLGERRRCASRARASAAEAPYRWSMARDFQPCVQPGAMRTQTSSAAVTAP